MCDLHQPMHFYLHVYEKEALFPINGNSCRNNSMLSRPIVMLMHEKHMVLVIKIMPKNAKMDNSQ